jgi:uncharacterized Zn-binding protein involved in type VI secretion
MRPFIVVGDPTDHGGTVVGGSVMTDTHGKRIARVGDQVTCPQKGHGPTVIVTGDPTMIIDGQPAARHGDKCACGATLISSQAVSTTSDGGASSPQKASAEQAAKAAASPAFRLAIDTGTGLLVREDITADAPFDQRFELTCRLTGVPLANQPYRMSAGGRVVEGVTDAKGLTQPIATGSEADDVVCEIMGDHTYG